MSATITYLGHFLTGEIKCWLGRRIVEIETPDGCRHIGRLLPDAGTMAPADGPTVRGGR